MTTLPAAVGFTGTTVTEDQQKTWISNLVSYLSGLLGTTGAPSTALAALQGLFASGVVGVPGEYTVTAADKGKVLSCYGAGGFILSLTAASTLGGLFAVAVRNSSVGIVTVNPSGSEVVNGALTLDLQPGDTAILVCTGGEWVSIGHYNLASIVPGVLLQPGEHIWQQIAGAVPASVSAWPTPQEAADAYPTYTQAANSRILRMEHRGSATFTWEHAKEASYSGTSYTRLLRNGVLQGAIETNTGTTFVQRARTVTFAPGDIIELQQHYSTSLGGSVVRNFRMLIDPATL